MAGAPCAWCSCTRSVALRFEGAAGVGEERTDAGPLALQDEPVDSKGAGRVAALHGKVTTRAPVAPPWLEAVHPVRPS